MSRGQFVVLDGIDGVGTTTHCDLLGEWLRSKNRNVLLTREPTDGKIGNLLRQYLREEAGPNDTIIDALLFAADRQEHQEIIRTALKAGKIVISDRYLESSICYQGLHLELEFIQMINKGAIRPDFTIILDIPAEISCQRKTMSEKFEKLETLKKVRACFLERAKKKDYFVVSTLKDIKSTQEKILEFLESRVL